MSLRPTNTMTRSKPYISHDTTQHHKDLTRQTQRTHDTRHGRHKAWQRQTTRHTRQAIRHNTTPQEQDHPKDKAQNKMRDKTRQDKTRHDKTRQDKTRDKIETLTLTLTLNLTLNKTRKEDLMPAALADTPLACR